MVWLVYSVLSILSIFYQSHFCYVYFNDINSLDFFVFVFLYLINSFGVGRDGEEEGRGGEKEIDIGREKEWIDR